MTLKHKNTTFTLKKGAIYPKALTLSASAKAGVLWMPSLRREQKNKGGSSNP